MDDVIQTEEADPALQRSHRKKRSPVWTPDYYLPNKKREMLATPNNYLFSLVLKL